jgi:protein gp37
MGKTDIEWATDVWNPLVGCTRVSPGCQHCYAERQAFRAAAMGIARYEGLTKKVGGEIRWTGEVRLVESALDLPLRWRRPRRIFVNSMSDLFHEKVSDDWLDKIFAVMALAPQHTYQILTKRPERMRAYFAAVPEDDVGWTPGARAKWGIADALSDAERWLRDSFTEEQWSQIENGADLMLPLPHVWLGVSVEDQATADERIPLLLQTPATVLWVSYEPALGPIDFQRWLSYGGKGFGLHDDWNAGPLIDWIVVGGESGPGARPFDLAWARATIAQCKAAGVSVFVKQLGAVPVGSVLYEAAWPAHVRVGWSGDGMGSYRVTLRDRKGGDPAEWPEDLRVREYPT